MKSDQKAKIFQIIIILFGLAAFNFILTSLGLMGPYGEFLFLGQFGVVGFFYSILLIIAVYIFTGLGIFSVIHSLWKRETLSLSAKAFSVGCIVLFLASILIGVQR